MFSNLFIYFCSASSLYYSLHCIKKLLLSDAKIFACRYNGLAFRGLFYLNYLILIVMLVNKQNSNANQALQTNNEGIFISSSSELYWALEAFSETPVEFLKLFSKISISFLSTEHHLNEKELNNLPILYEILNALTTNH